MTLKELVDILKEENEDKEDAIYSRDKNKKVEFYTSDTHQALTLLSVYPHKGKIIIDIG